MPSYQPHEVGNKQLAIGYWITTHRLQMKRLGSGLFLAIATGLLLNGIYGLVDYFVLQRKQTIAWEQQLAVSGMVHRDYASKISAQDLNVTSVGIVENEESADAFASVANPNDRWYARFSYHFSLGDYNSPVFEGFTLPGEEKTLTGFSLTLPKDAATVILVFDRLDWTHVSNHDISDYAAWAGDRQKITIKDLVYAPPAQLHENSSLVVSRVTYTAVNNSIFDYWEVGFLIIGIRDDRPVALQRKVVSPLVSGKATTQVVSWFGIRNRFDSIRIEPEIDILNPESYWTGRNGIFGVEE
ncbi:MAG: hypothetical protein COT39_01105 [Parcubacteria group bacterium CG08_land_8_20_14_0_20_48_21]|nr:MAG: hypothetical protein AUK21_02060 [Parcubacteria group bacterium CG2_30_48_51]PIS33054.1 MAG: hypothetical protein COT39_01105 [Parcubacteria group bacterium CG08_land_8_20_14_0_20_48_21]PIW79194.1 MAG: hypothetical protein COZ99_02090 [Parcubacteria group bacterium CG_4_8_14_3_um_filter_48_16]PIY77876.1 MAG: hypothetical protein COY83_02995 [Parcubacteria group bacterium CG_4_10_14_0_8_um_filter_48_154]PIZ77315.1 MAG: hypothetical protein COY03_03225 [bacterium CG_4_10_14_0_2_um_filter_